MKKRTLSHIIDIISGGTPRTTVPEYWGGDIGWLAVNDFNNDNRFVYSSEKTITQLGVDKSSTKFLEKGDVIISARGTVGALAQIGTPMCFNQSCFGLRGKDGVIENDYLYYLLKNYVANIVKRSQGSVFDTINLASFDLMEVMMHPSIKTQKLISSILGSLDSKIELNNQINQQLEEMAKTIYDYWFVQFDFPNEEGKPYKSSGGKMVYNKQLKREIPEGWEVKSLSDVAEITMGQSPAGKSYNEEGRGEIFFQGSTDFGWRFPEIRQYTTEPNRMANAGDILLSVRAPVGTLNIASDNCCIGRGLSAIKSKDGYNSFLYNALIWHQKAFEIRNNIGTTFGAITRDDLFSLKILYPSESHLNRFNEIAQPIDEKILVNHRESQQLSSLRDWLLPMLMNGQVIVGGRLKSVELIE